LEVSIVIGGWRTREETERDRERLRKLLKQANPAPELVEFYIDKFYYDRDSEIKELVGQLKRLQAKRLEDEELERRLRRLGRKKGVRRDDLPWG
jgi:hypothetical protein